MTSYFFKKLAKKKKRRKILKIKANSKENKTEDRNFNDPTSSPYSDLPGPLEGK